MILVLGSLLAFAVLIFRTDLNWLEFAGLVLGGGIALAQPRWGERWFRRAESSFRGFASRRVLGVGLVGTLAVAVRLVLLPLAPPPEPAITDEFSHLLLADTLSHGRLTNPTHPMWRHLETIHEIQRPTYNSMYFPGQALFLAVGQVVAGSAWVGVLLSVGLMCGAICWALQGWLPANWALLGGLIAVLRLSLFSYWTNSYWGGAVPALGGALVIGGWARIRRKPDVLPALIMSAGLLLLMISRPFEGLVLSLPIAAAMLAWGWKQWRDAGRILARVVAPISIAGAIGVSMLGYYQSRVTGSFFRPPYLVNQQTYGWPLTLPWFASGAATQPNPQMREWYAFEKDEHEKVADPLHNIFRNVVDAVLLWTFFCGPILTAALFFLPRVARDRRIRLPLVIVTCLLTTVAIEQSRYPHYFAPATAALTIVIVQGLRHLRAAGKNRPALLTLSRVLPLILLTVVAVRALVPALASGQNSIYHHLSWCCGRPGNLSRAAVESRLEKVEGQQLVFVRYLPQHQFMYEWVYNEADIDHAKVIWVRDMGEDSNGEVCEYFHNRHVWTVVADAASPLASLMLIRHPDREDSEASQRSIRRDSN